MEIIIPQYHIGTGKQINQNQYIFQMIYLTDKYHFCLSQREIAHILKISQNAVSKKEKSLKKYFQKFLQKGCQKP